MSARIFFDTEFIEDGRTIEMVSLGAVRDDGRLYYAQALDWNPRLASKWVEGNVFPHLKRCNPDLELEAEMAEHRGRGPCSSFCSWRNAIDMRQELIAFAGREPEFWADYASYDWVALCQLFGPMVNLPLGWPFFCRDVQQLRDQFGQAKLPERANAHKPEHNALKDALDCRRRHDYLMMLRGTIAA